ncbi:MAG: biotin--[acetyl-CoA-carboxylase] ligase [Bacteriovoracaceae bacterium]|nr:biotin--[acetyl-CoA-carboxylase] ligase [Bacteriovoracaceae bacterium]
MINIWQQHFAQLPSTQLELRANLALYQQKAQAVLISATTQTGGIGQYGRTWQTNRNAIAFSCTIMPDQLPATPLPLSIIWGLMILKYFQKLGKNGLQLKWPNDLVINDHKCGGILVEKQAGSMLCGIGLNWGALLPAESTSFASLKNYIPLPAASIFPTQTLMAEDYARLPRKIYQFALDYLAHAQHLLGAKLPEILAQTPWWRLNEQVVVTRADQQELSGTFTGVTPDGAAIGGGQKIYSGSLSCRV